MAYISKMANGKLVDKILIKYYSNNSEESDEEEKEPINIYFTEQKSYPYNDENDNNFRWSDLQEQDKEGIALANFIESP